jgi:hypothetical protein
MITRTLQGIVRLSENGAYLFSLPKITGTSLPNALDNSVLEEIYIIVEENISVQIYLPNISEFNNAWNSKIYILAKGSASIYPTNVEGKPQNYINYFDVKDISLGVTAYFHISNFENYACWITDGGIQPLPQKNFYVTLQYSGPNEFQLQDVAVIEGAPSGQFYTIAEINLQPIPNNSIYTLSTYNAGSPQVGQTLISEPGSVVTVVADITQVLE